MPTILPSSGPGHQYGTQGPVPGLGSDQATMQPSSEHGRALRNPETSMIIRKRLGSPQPTKVQRFSAIQRQLAKRTGVPELSLVVMCFNPEPQQKRRRTDNQKQDKKNVENVGGSCFLCRVFKKKVPRFVTDLS